MKQNNFPQKISKVSFFLKILNENRKDERKFQAKTK